VVPAFNEEAGIREGLSGFANQQYPLCELIVVDDGSSDLTAVLAEDDRFRVLRMPQNGGKVAALNAGLAEARGEIIVFSDGDSRLDSTAVVRLVSHFSDPKVGAVAGCIVPKRRSGLLARWQTVEYALGQFILKPAQLGAGGSVLVCPGPVCAFRRDLLISLGGFTPRTLVEDFDATIRVIRAGHRVAFEPDAIAYTDTPACWRDLARQRLRWSRGYLQICRVHADLGHARCERWAGRFWLPYQLLIGFGVPAADVAGLLLLGTVFAVSTTPAAVAEYVALGLLVLELIAVIQSVCALSLAKCRDPLTWLAACLAKPFNAFLTLVRLQAMAVELARRPNTW
jgi:cellulose synthase/poly-beta-1,6-N-acetylglucosamine synthase-like glycosyltransferase